MEYKKDEALVYIIDNEYKIVHFNNAAKTLYPKTENGKFCYSVICNKNEVCTNCPLKSDNDMKNSCDGLADKRFNVNITDIDWQNKSNCHIIITNNISKDNNCKEHYDILTDLPVNTAYYNKVQKLFSNHTETEYCLIALDIEHFKMFNELYGKNAGDDFLIDISKQLKIAEKKYDGIAGYFGEDNFCIIIPNHQEFIEDFEKTITDNIKQNKKYTGFSAVFGIYVIKDKNMPILAMYDRAIIAISHIKKNYNLHLSVFADEMLRDLEQEHKMRLDMQRALNEKEFIFYLQPQCDMHSGRIVGAEALVRWKHKTKGMVSPGQFIPQMEKNGFIIDVDKYIWEEVFKWQRSLSDKGIKPVPVSVNVSRAEIYLIDITEFFCSLVKKYKLNPSLIKIEITESAYIEDFGLIKSTIESLQKAGFKVLMDDFGSGYSSLNMLKSINIDVLKLDMKFLQISKNDAKKGIGILESVVDMARMMRIPMISEGVETEEQKNTLMDMGCLYAQGYYFYKPMSVEDFERFLQENNKADYRGLRIRQVEQMHIREFFDSDLFTDTVLNNILGAVAFFEVCDSNVEIVRVNEQYYRVTGIESSQKENYRKNILDYIYKEDHKILFDMFEKAYENRVNGAEGDIRYFKNDGNIVWLNLRIFFITTRNGKRMYYATLNDITERYNHEQILYSTQKALLSAVQVSEDDGLMELSEENKRIISSIYAKTNFSGVIGSYCEEGFPLYFADNKFLALLGYDSYEEFKENVNNLFENAIHPEDREGIISNFKINCSVGTEYITTCRIMRKDGSYFWTKNKSTIINTDNNRPAIICVCTDITETINVQDHILRKNDFLIKQNQELKFLNNDMPGGYYRCSKEAGYPFLYISDRFLNMFGYSREEIVEKFDNKFINMVHPEDFPIAQNRIKDIERTDNNYQAEYRMLSKNGYLWVVDQSRLMEYKQQEFFQGIVIDVTESVELRNRMKLLMEYTPQDIFVVTKNKKDGISFKVLASGLLRKSGISKEQFEEELNSRKYYQRIDRLTEKQLFLQFKEAMQNHISYSQTFGMKNIFGNKVFLHLDASYIGEDDECIKYLCICNDVTNDKKKDKELSITNKKLETTLNLVGINSWEWNIEERTLTIINTTDDGVIERFFGKRKQTPIVINNFPLCFMRYNLIPEEYKEMFVSFIERTQNEDREAKTVFEMPFITKNGETIWLCIHSSTIFDLNGKTVYAVGSYSDITQKVKTRIEHKQNMKMLELLRKFASYNMKVNILENKIYDKDYDEKIVKIPNSLTDNYDEFINTIAEHMVHKSYKNRFLMFTDRKNIINKYNSKQEMESLDYIGIINGKERWLRMIMYVTQLDNPKDIWSFFFFSDIEESTQEHIQFTQISEMFDSIACGVLRYNENTGKILAVNRVALEILGYKSKEEMEQSGFDGVASTVFEDDKKILRETARNLEEINQTLETKYRIIHNDGRVLNVLGNTQLLSDNNGERIIQRTIMVLNNI